MTTNKVHGNFYCEPCRAWTVAEGYRDGAYWDEDGDVIEDPVRELNPNCSVCGEFYGCGECGFEIDPTGECTRPDCRLWCAEMEAEDRADAEYHRLVEEGVR